jgi:hypothetical protein
MREITTSSMPQDRRVTVTDPLADAIAELYSADPDEFVQRRGALVSRAREAGHAAAAKRIAALRKPTRSAWVVNQLVRAQPGVIDSLSGLGEELRSAQRSLAGDAIRELSRRRRQLVEDLVRQALEISGQRSPPAVLRDEVTATLSAAVADPEVAEKLAAGTLERAAHHEGFGTAGPPVLSLVPPLAEGERAEDERAEDERAARRGRGRAARPARPAAGQAGQGGARSQAPQGQESQGPTALRGTRSRGGRAAGRGAGSGAGPATRPAAAEDAATQAERARQERERRLADAERQASDADSAADAATTTEQEQEAAVRQLEEQLAQARVRLADVRQQARRARAGQRRARQALDRLRQ